MEILKQDLFQILRNVMVNISSHSIFLIFSHHHHHHHHHHHQQQQMPVVDNFVVILSEKLTQTTPFEQLKLWFVFSFFLLLSSSLFFSFLSFSSLFLLSSSLFSPFPPSFLSSFLPSLSPRHYFINFINIFSLVWLCNYRWFFHQSWRFFCPWSGYLGWFRMG